GRRMNEGGVLELVGLAYAASHDRTKWAPYLERLRTETGAAATYLLGADLTGSNAGVLEGPLAASDADRRYQDYYHRIDEFALAYLRSGIRTGQVWGSHQLIPDAHMAASEFYNDLLRQFDYFYCAGSILVQEGPSMVGFGILRSRRQGAPEPDAMRLLGALAPHQQRAMQIDRRMSQLEAVQRVSGGILDGLPYGLIALDRRGRVLAMNRMAVDIVAARDGLQLGPDGLAGLRPREDGLLRQAITAALTATPSGGAVELPRPSHLRPLRLILAPVPRERPLRA